MQNVIIVIFEKDTSQRYKYWRLILTKNSCSSDAVCSIDMEFGTILFLVVMLLPSNTGDKLWKVCTLQKINGN